MSEEDFNTARVRFLLAACARRSGVENEREATKPHKVFIPCRGMPDVSCSDVAARHPSERPSSHLARWAEEKVRWHHSCGSRAMRLDVKHRTYLALSVESVHRRERFASADADRLELSDEVKELTEARNALQQIAERAPRALVLTGTPKRVAYCTS